MTKDQFLKNVYSQYPNAIVDYVDGEYVISTGCTVVDDEVVGILQ